MKNYLKNMLIETMNNCNGLIIKEDEFSTLLEVIEEMNERNFLLVKLGDTEKVSLSESNIYLYEGKTDLLVTELPPKILCYADLTIVYKEIYTETDLLNLGMLIPTGHPLVVVNTDYRIFEYLNKWVV